MKRFPSEVFGFLLSLGSKFFTCSWKILFCKYLMDAPLTLQPGLVIRGVPAAWGATEAHNYISDRFFSFVFSVTTSKVTAANDHMT